MDKTETHESYGKIEISRFSSNGSQFFGSDLVHQGGMKITISRAKKNTDGSRESIFATNEVIRVELSNSQFVEAITSGMNTSGVPCTIQHIDGKRTEFINHVTDKQDKYRNTLNGINDKYNERLNGITKMLESGAIGKRKAKEILHEVNILKTNINSNSSYVMDSFNKEMVNTVQEAKHSISNYIDHKVHTLGIEGIKEQLQIEIESKK